MNDGSDGTNPARPLWIVAVLIAGAVAANLVAAGVYAFFTEPRVHGPVERLRLATVSVTSGTALTALAAVAILALDTTRRDDTAHPREAVITLAAVAVMSALIMAVGAIRTFDIAVGNVNYAGQVKGHVAYRLATALSELVVALLGGAAAWWSVRLWRRSGR